MNVVHRSPGELSGSTGNNFELGLSVSGLLDILRDNSNSPRIKIRQEGCRAVLPGYVYVQWCTS